MLRKINVAWIALVALPLLFTGCQSEEQTPTPEPAPAPAPLTPFLSKIFKNGVILREYTYEGTRPVKVIDYTNKAVVFKTGTMSYDAAGRLTRISVRSAAFPSEEEDQTYTYNADGLLAKVEFTAVNNARTRRTGEVNLVSGETFQYSSFEYDAKKMLIKSADFAKYNWLEDGAVSTGFTTPYYYTTHEYDASGNAVKKTSHSVLTPGFDVPEFVDVHTFTYDTQKNPYFYSYLLDEGTPNPRITKHNMLTRRTTSNGPMDGHHYDCTIEYDANGFPTKKTYLEGGGYLSADRTIVYTYEYEMR
jgi:hypothetical protein